MDKKIISKDLNKGFFSSRKKEKDKLNSGLTSTYIIMLSVISILLLHYVWTINASANKGYIIRELETQKKLLIEEKNTLDQKIAQIESLYYLNENKSYLEYMEKAQNPEYLVIKEGVQYVYNN